MSDNDDNSIYNFDDIYDLICKERISDFIEFFDKITDKKIENLKNISLKNHIPIIRNNTLNLLKILLMIKRPQNILEVGTATGYSSIIMSNLLPASYIDTIENNINNINVAENNISVFGLNNKITLYKKDATEVLCDFKNNGIKNKYDFIFLDAAKSHYNDWLDSLVDVLNINGILFADNVLKNGEIVENRFGIIKRNRTIHTKMRNFLYNVSNHQYLYTRIINIDDGVTISVKIKHL